MPLPFGTRAVLLDIEGTTTPISFVYDVLFPFARAGLDRACSRSSDDERIQQAIVMLREEYEDEGPADVDFGTGADYARFLMDQDRKSTGLKALQGVIWEDGYASGDLRARVFEDVPGALEAWRRAGARLRIFSSGSVLAQKLLFAHTEHGDLTGYFEGYHDTTTGPKRESGAYLAIACAFGLEPGSILFLSDVVAELDAARAAGMKTGLLRRPGNAPTEADGHAAYDGLRPLS